MQITEKLLLELQNRLKVGNRRGVHLNAIPARSRYKFDLTRLSHIEENLPKNFINALLTDQPLKFKISWKDNVPDLNSLFEEDQAQLVKITKSFENLINQTDAIESEKGINTFGFGYPILARRDQSDNKLTVAPILIWSLRIRRTKEFNTWEILRGEDDPIYINEVLINHLQSDSKIEIEQISSEFLDDGLIDKEELLDICVNLITSINSTTPNDLRDTFEKKIQEVKPIPSKKHYEKLPLNSNNSFIDFGGLFSIFEVQKQNIIHDYGNLLDLEGTDIDLSDMDEHTFQPISSVETDPSQQSILHSLESSRNILIQGPTGTGKSQSLTAVLVNALENKKKTIVVCEKRTALEVLHNSLNEKGLNYQCVLLKDIVKDRRAAVDSVRDRVDNSSYKRYRYNHSKETLDNIIEQSKGFINSINKKHKKLSEKIVGNKNWTHTVGWLLSELKDTTEPYNLDLKNKEFTYESSELNEFLEIIRKAQNLYSDYKPHRDLSIFNSKKYLGNNPFSIEQEIKSDFEKYRSDLAEIQEKVSKYHESYFDIRKNEIADQIEEYGVLVGQINKTYPEIDLLISNIEKNHLRIRKEDFDNQIKIIEKETSEVKNLYKEFSDNPTLLNEEELNSFSFKLKSIFSKNLKELKKASQTITSKVAKIESLLFECNDLNNYQFNSNLTEKKRDFYNFLEYLEDTKSSFSNRNHNELKSLKLETFLDGEINSQSCITEIGLNINSKQISTTYKEFLKQSQNDLINIEKKILNEFNDLTKFSNKAKDLESLNFSSSLNLRKNELLSLEDSFSKMADELILKLNEETKNIDVLNDIEPIYRTESLVNVQKAIGSLKAKFDQHNWTRKKISFDTEKEFYKEYNSLFESYDNFYENEEDLFSIEFKWFQYYNSLSKLHQNVIDELQQKDDWKKTFLIYYLNSMLVNSANMDLPTDDNDHIELGKSLSEIEREQIKYIREYWFSKQIDATRQFDQQNSNLSVENLYNKRSSNRHKRLSLRQIVKFDIDLFTTMFPIILTTPDVCSNLFKGKNQYFDIVMFDEASQLKLEDNLPALLKGKQIVIAGDEHQMPPSNYFSKIFDGDIEDEDDFEDEDEIRVDRDNILLSCESLLDFASELSFEKKHLDFHYRSRHPYLIDFSNYAFYNQRLKPLPNEFDYVPIKYIPTNGTYSDHTNDTEAETILSIIDKNISRLPNGEYPTVGIATFNIAQRNLIKSKIIERRKFDRYSDFNEKILELEENGLFVKNLENIQGDERDVIILSTTYGYTKDGKFAQRFGPINHKKGYKLLNVIVTRAKYKVYVCSSIPEEVFLNYREHLRIEGSNNRRAAFFSYLAYCKAVSEQDDESRLAVLNALAENSIKSETIDILNEDLESPFEEEVYQALAEHFSEDKIIPQLQFAGFRIDMVYDTKHIGLPKIAIECDGAAYHSSREAYLHDRHRQKILEGHGFVFHRIWSTNWWRNPKKETESLVNFIKSIENSNPSIFEDKSNTGKAFTDNIVVAKNEIVRESPITETALEETIKAISKPKNDQTELFKDEIKLNSKVKVKYLNNGKDIKVHLIDGQVSVNQKTNGVQKINIKSPLGVSLLGKVKGETVKIGNLDNYVEILEILN